MATGEVLLAAGIGVAAGLHSATWGMFKDAPHEGFTWKTYVRSPLLSALLAIGIALLGRVDVTSAAGLAVLFGATYGLERMLIELYKTFLREEDQSKYTIPMQLAVAGRLVKRRAVRLGLGALYFSAELLLLYGAHWLQRRYPAGPGLLVAGLVGSAGGWGSAFGGAWKDAPFEGFSILKFFRSPAIAFSYGVALGMLTPSTVLIFLGAIGYTVATTETYKTFFFPNKNRGKFMGKEPRHPELLRRRWRFVPLYVAIWAAVIVTGGIALIRARQDGWRPPQSEERQVGAAQEAKPAMVAIRCLDPATERKRDMAVQGKIAGRGWMA